MDRPHHAEHKWDRALNRWFGFDPRVNEWGPCQDVGRVTGHEHLDGSGGGCRSCGAERCSLPGCDGYCVHPGGWVERAELRELRRPSAEAYMRGLLR